MDRKDVEILLEDNVTTVKNKELWIFGAGNTAALYYNGLLRLEKEGFYIKGYIDNDKRKWGQQWNNKEIVSLDSLINRKKNICILICSIQSKVVDSISRQLSEAEFEYYHIDEVIFKLHKEEILQVYDLLEKDSKEIYAILLKERMQCEGIQLPVDMNEQYFALRPFMFSNPGEIFVDCGAYVGDTIERYIWKRDGVFKKIIGFEPDKKNYLAMWNRVKRLNLEWGLDDNAIEIYEKGVADRTLRGRVERYENNHGLGSKIIDVTDGACTTIALDTFLKQPYSFLKADIESWEYKLIKGAQEGIKSNRPLLAICIYHNAVDFYQIPLLIHQIVPEYNLAIRHHSHTLAETVLYAWIP